MFLALLNNAALPLALAVVAEQLLGRSRRAGVRALVLAGVVVGGLAVAVMAFPVPFGDGVVFDSRSVVLGLSAVFFHPVVGVIAGVIAAAGRWLMGGAGALVGIAVIVTSVGLGALARRLWRGRLEDVTYRELYAFGWVLQLTTIGWIATIPGGIGPAAASTIALPSLAILPVATAALGWTLARRARHERLAEAMRLSEHRLRRAIDASPSPTLVLDEQGELVHVGATWLEASGYRREQLPTYAAWARLAYGDDDATARARLAQAFDDAAGERSTDREVRLASGERAVWSVASAPLDVGGDQDRRLAVVTATDVTERRQLERERRLAALVFDAAGDAMLLTDRDSRIVKANPAVRTVTGFDPDGVVGREAMAFGATRNPPDLRRSIDAALAARGRWDGEVWTVRADGSEFLADVAVTVTPDPNDERRVIVFSDVTERKRTEERIWREANYDALTGLPNRRHLHERLQHVLERAQRDGGSVAVLLLDLDRFKEVNDVLGHAEGDALLRELAQRIERCIRSSDTVARMGGDEFAIVLADGGDRSGIERVAEEVLAAIAAPVQLRDDLAHVSASIGVALYPSDASSIDDLLKSADQALYAAKDAGRGRWSFFDPEMERALLERRDLIRDLRAALDEGAFDVAYQPVVDLRTGRTYAVEALLRWPHPTRGIVPPSRFVPLAEETGLIVPLGDWVLERALTQVARWRAGGHPDLRVSVNVSPVQIVNRSIDWAERLRAHDLPGQALVVEITEGLLLDDRPQVVEQLLSLRSLGVAVALDDFGTGYSSLAYLRRLDIDYLKIDRAFVRDLGSSVDDRALSEAIVVMAHRLGLQVVAEGIETTEQARALREAGCDLGQGYWLARPMAAAAIEPLLTRTLPDAAEPSVG